MKVRKGFVSNSSSSSFVVQFDKNPMNREYLREVLFDNQDVIRYEYDDKIIFAVDDLIDWVMNELKKGEVTDIEPIVEIMNNGYIPEIDHNFSYPSASDLEPEEWSKLWDERNKERERLAKKYAERWMDGREFKHIYVMEFSDQDGAMGSQLEHGGTFSKLDHKIISNH